MSFSAEPLGTPSASGTLIGSAVASGGFFFPGFAFPFAPLPRGERGTADSPLFDLAEGAGDLPQHLAGVRPGGRVHWRTEVGARLLEIGSGPGPCLFECGSAEVLGPFQLRDAVENVLPGFQG